MGCVDGCVEIRALDGEKKALVYDNYSKLIAAVETIRKVGTYIYYSITWYGE